MMAFTMSDGCGRPRCARFFYRCQPSLDEVVGIAVVGRDRGAPRHRREDPGAGRSEAAWDVRAILCTVAIPNELVGLFRSASFPALHRAAGKLATHLRVWIGRGHDDVEQDAMEVVSLLESDGVTGVLVAEHLL